MTKHDILLDVQHVSHVFPLTKQVSVKALDDISFQIHRGEIFGLVGESGSGNRAADAFFIMASTSVTGPPAARTKKCCKPHAR